MATTAGHYAIQTPRSEIDAIHSLNADELTFASQEPSFVSPSKQQKHPIKPSAGTTFISKLTQPTALTPLAEIKNHSRPTRFGSKNEFTPLLKSVTKQQFMKRPPFAAQTPSKLRHVLAKSASTPDLREEASIEEGFTAEDSQISSEKELSELSRASDSFQKLPHRSPGSNDGAALLTLREQEKVHLTPKNHNITL
jgi:hypothetical protein